MWLFDSTPSVTPVDAVSKIKEQGAILIDVRTPPEFASGHARGAVNYPLAQFDTACVEGLKKFNEVYVICHSGARGVAATTQLRGAQISAFNISGGTSAWQAAGLPIE